MAHCSFETSMTACISMRMRVNMKKLGIQTYKINDISWLNDIYKLKAKWVNVT